MKRFTIFIVLLLLSLALFAAANWTIVTNRAGTFSGVYTVTCRTTNAEVTNFQFTPLKGNIAPEWYFVTLLSNTFTMEAGTIQIVNITSGTMYLARTRGADATTMPTRLVVRIVLIRPHSLIR